jgi:hypothetical protein
MKFKIKKITFGVGCIFLSLLGMTSCNLFGLDLQQNYNYVHTPINLKMDMTAYQFVESRKNIDMSILYEAINRINYKDSFEVQNRTYFILNDIAFSGYLSNQKFAGLKNMTNSQVTKLLNQYIVIGLYPSLSLTNTPLTVQTIDPATKLSIFLKNVSIDTAIKYLVQVKIVGSTSNPRDVVTSNLQPTNGIIHVLDYSY